MPFHTYSFIFAFLPVSLIGYFVLCRLGCMTLRKAWLVGASLVFYALFLPAHAPVLILSVGVNYALSGYILRTGERQKGRKAALILGLVLNLGALGYFKYTTFVLDALAALTGTPWGSLRILLPVGISFFTFQQVAYLIDCYVEGDLDGTAPPHTLLDYAAFVTFFPQILAGPIPLRSETLPQIQDDAAARFDLDNLARGAYMFARGLAKKVLLAGTFAKVANFGFAPGVRLNMPEAWLVAVAYALEMYLDFSGYCDMGMGVARVLGIRLPQNFNSPYKALTIKDFWARWHMTLTRFFQNYVYVPFVFSGKHKGMAKMQAGVVLIFLLSGLWHGAGWMFILWGLLHGVAMVSYNLLRKRVDKLHPALNWAMTFVFVTVALVFFRAPDMATAGNMLGSMFGMQMGGLNGAIVAAFGLPFSLLPAWTYTLMLAWFLVVLGCLLGMRNTVELAQSFRPTFWHGLAVVGMVFWSVLSLSGVSNFIYANF